MINKLHAGYKIVVTRNIGPNSNYKKFAGGYPPNGTTGILQRIFREDLIIHNNGWVVKWDNAIERVTGDLVYEWMIEKLVEDWDN